MQEKLSFDLVLCLDASGSCLVVFVELRYNFDKFLPALIDSLKEKYQTNDISLRVKVVAFRDYEADAVPMEETKFFIYPDEEKDLKQFIEEIDIYGGGDLLENALEGLVYSIKSDWRKEAKQCITLISDMPPLKLGKRAVDFIDYPKDMPKNMEELSDLWFNKNDNVSFDYKRGSLVIISPDCDEYNQIEKEWQNVLYHKIKPMAGVHDLEYTDIINDIVASLK